MKQPSKFCNYFLYESQRVPAVFFSFSRAPMRLMVLNM